LRFAADRGRDKPIESDLLECAEYGGDVSMGQAADDLEVILVCGQRLASESSSDDFDQVIWQVGEVSEGEVLDLSILSERMSKQMGDVSLPFVLLPDGGYVNRALFSAHAADHNEREKG
jgi:hypothetical protein